MDVCLLPLRVPGPRLHCSRSPSDRVISIHRESYIRRAIEEGLAQATAFGTADADQHRRAQPHRIKKRLGD
eukprot:171234-Pelagomonas_calceolata.AAC.5